MIIPDAEKREKRNWIRIRNSNEKGKHRRNPTSTGQTCLKKQDAWAAAARAWRCGEVGAINRGFSSFCFQLERKEETMCECASFCTWWIGPDNFIRIIYKLREKGTLQRNSAENYVYFCKERRNLSGDVERESVGEREREALIMRFRSSEVRNLLGEVAYHLDMGDHSSCRFYPCYINCLIYSFSF